MRIEQELEGLKLLDLSDRNYTLAEVVEKFWRDPVFPMIPSDSIARQALFDALKADVDGVAWEIVGPTGDPIAVATPELLAPMVEYLVKWNELLQFFWQEPVKPVDGMISVSDRPGLGVEIDPGKIEAEEELQWSAVPNMTGSVQIHQQTSEEGE